MITVNDFKIGWIIALYPKGGSGTPSKFLCKEIRPQRDDWQIHLFNEDGVSDIGWYNISTTFNTGYDRVELVKKFSLKEETFGTDEYLERMGIK